MSKIKELELLTVELNEEVYIARQGLWRCQGLLSGLNRAYKALERKKKQWSDEESGLLALLIMISGSLEETDLRYLRREHKISLKDMKEFHNSKKIK